MRSLPWMTGAIGVVVGAAGALTFARAPEASPNADAAAAAEDAGPPAPMRDAGLAATLDAGAPDAGPAPIDAFAFAPILDVRTTAERVAVVPGWRYTVCGMATVADENADGGTPLREARLGGITCDGAISDTPPATWTLLEADADTLLGDDGVRYRRDGFPFQHTLELTRQDGTRQQVPLPLIAPARAVAFDAARGLAVLAAPPASDDPCDSPSAADADDAGHVDGGPAPRSAWEGSLLGVRVTPGASALRVSGGWQKTTCD